MPNGCSALLKLRDHIQFGYINFFDRIIYVLFLLFDRMWLSVKVKFTYLLTYLILLPGMAY